MPVLLDDMLLAAYKETLKDTIAWYEGYIFQQSKIPGTHTLVTQATNLHLRLMNMCRSMK